jgi:hypothetical protein
MDDVMERLASISMPVLAAKDVKVAEMMIFQTAVDLQ